MLSLTFSSLPPSLPLSLQTWRHPPYLLAGLPLAGREGLVYRYSFHAHFLPWSLRTALEASHGVAGTYVAVALARGVEGGREEEVEEGGGGGGVGRKGMYRRWREGGREGWWGMCREEEKE